MILTDLPSASNALNFIGQREGSDKEKERERERERERRREYASTPCIPLMDDRIDTFGEGRITVSRLILANQSE